MNRKLIDNTYIRTREEGGFSCHTAKRIEKGDIVMECVIPAELITSNTFFMRGCRWTYDNDNEFIPLGNVLMIGQTDKNNTPNIEWSISKEERLVRGHAVKQILKNEVLRYSWEDFIYKPDELS